jgi:hypothetical protein
MRAMTDANSSSAGAAPTTTGAPLDLLLQMEIDAGRRALAAQQQALFSDGASPEQPLDGPTQP